MKLKRLVLILLLFAFPLSALPPSLFANPQPLLEVGNDAIVRSGSYYIGISTYTYSGLTPLSVSIDYGDGLTIEQFVIPQSGDSSGSFSMFHQYIKPAGVESIIYTLTVTIDDGDGGTATDFLLINVIDPKQPPGIEPIVAPSNIYAGQLLVFDIIAYDPNNLPITISGSGLPAAAHLSPAVAINGTNKYKSVFTWQTTCEDVSVYDMNFTAINTQLMSFVVNMRITVKAYPPVADAGGPYVISLGDGVILDGSASGTPYASAGWCIESYEWDLNNDNNPDFSGVTVAITAAQLAELDIDSPGGTYPVTLKVTDSGGNIATDITDISILAQYSVTVNYIGQGSVNIDPLQEKYDAGSVMQLTAVPAPGYSFSHWEGGLSGITDAVANITLNSNITITAVFTINYYQLTVDVIGSGSVVMSSPSTSLPYGTVVQLTAVPAEGYIFEYWQGDVAGSTNLVEITVDAAKTVTAVFSKVKVYYELTTGIVGNGNVSIGPAGDLYEEGTSVTINATPAPGYVFHHWEGAVNSETNPVTLLMDADKAVTVVFVPATYTLTIDISGNGTVHVSPLLAFYEYGSEVHLSAQPDTGYRFDRWQGLLAGSGDSATLVMNSDATITAVFAPLTVPTSLVITSAATQAAGSVQLAALLTTSDSTPLAEQSVTFSVNGQLYMAITNDLGVALVTLPLSPELYSVEAAFSGDAFYLPSNALAQLYVYQDTRFVIWGGNVPGLTVGQSVYFWGAQWWQQVNVNSFRSSSFKGWADNFGSIGWVSDPGSSSNPPVSVGKYITAIVSTKIVKEGKIITGDVAGIAVIRVDNPAGYKDNSGQSATGVIVAFLP